MIEAMGIGDAWNTFIREQLDARGLTATKVAEDLGINRKTVCQGSRRRNPPTLYVMDRVCKYLGITYKVGATDGQPCDKVWATASLESMAKAIRDRCLSGYCSSCPFGSKVYGRPTYECKLRENPCNWDIEEEKKI